MTKVKIRYMNGQVVKYEATSTFMHENYISVTVNKKKSYIIPYCNVMDILIEEI